PLEAHNGKIIAECRKNGDSLWRPIPIIRDPLNPKCITEWDTKNYNGIVNLRLFLGNRGVIKNYFVGVPEIAATLEINSPQEVEIGSDGFCYVRSVDGIVKINELNKIVKTFENQAEQIAWDKRQNDMMALFGAHIFGLNSGEKKVMFFRKALPAGNIFLNTDMFICFGYSNILYKYDMTAGAFVLKIPFQLKGQLNHIEINGEKTAVVTDDSIYVFNGTSKEFSIGQINAQKATWDSKGNIFILYNKENRIAKYDVLGNRLYEFGSYGEGSHSLDNPTDIACFKDFLYVCDSGNNRVKKYKIGTAGEKDVSEKSFISVGTVPLRISEAHFVPSPYASRTGNGIIRYDLSKDADVKIAITTAIGRGVTHFNLKLGVNGGRAGWNQVRWDGRNSLGRLCNNGVYIFIIEASSGTEKSRAQKKFSVLN
ncbi:MAG: hypothetical protein AB1633_09710, partial [Elusimicrobiota bacterium]